MNQPQKALITALYESYEDSPVLKGLVQALSISGVPIGPIIDSSLGTYVNRIKVERLKTFFDELNQGDVVLTEEQIKSNGFLNAYFDTVSYVLRTKSDDKIRRFALILKKVYLGKLTIEDFDDYTAVFNNLTDREFAILTIKYKYEQKYISNPENLNRLQLTSKYWDDFKCEISEKLNIKESEINAFLIRLQRTGCYLKHKGYWDESEDEIGNTTDFFKAIMNVIKE